MSEAYPSDQELLGLVSDSETGVEYIETGRSPYYLQFRRLLYRLILSARRANDLRVYDEGGLDIGVKGGRFWLGTTLVSYAGSSGNTLADDKASIYVYLDAAGGLVTEEYAGFPDMAVAPHVRLAVVTTSAGDITNIVDSREGHNFVLPYASGGVKRETEAHSGDDTLTESESGSIHTNLGAAGTVTLTLPGAASPGTQFCFAVQSGQELRIDPGTAAIRDSSGQTGDKYKSASSIGSCISLAADANGDWAVIGKSGTWTEEA